MGTHSTYLSDEAVERIIQASGEEIRLFLDFLGYPKKKSPYSSLKNVKAVLAHLSADMRQCAENFRQNPSFFSDQRMVEMGEGVEEAIKNFVRIEIRRTPAIGGAAQVVSKGIEGDFRMAALKRLRAKKGFRKSELTIKFAGRSSIEFNVAGVNKALPFKYLEKNLAHVLKVMGYTSGSLIDAARSKTIIAADGDSTMYGGPTLTTMPTLQESPTKEPLNKYLRMGGVFMLISGNNLERTVVRVKEGIEDLLKNRFILVGNGGASMAVFGKNGQLIEIEDYRLNALRLARAANKKRQLDMIYIGNDGHPNGNDMDGFKEVGFGRSFLVEEENASVAQSTLKKHFIPGLENAAGKLLFIINDMIRVKRQAPYFTKEAIAAVLKRARS